MLEIPSEKSSLRGGLVPWIVDIAFAADDVAIIRRNAGDAYHHRTFEILNIAFRALLIDLELFLRSFRRFI